MNTELIVPFNRESQKLGLITILCTIAAAFYLFSLSFLLHYIFNFYVVLAIQNLLLWTITFFGITFFYTLFKRISNKPAAILNQTGIWIHNWGFVSWDNIEEIDTYFIGTIPLEIIGIRIKDLSLSRKEATFSGKIGIFLARLFSYHYHISLMQLALENSQIIAFAREFIQKE